ncbi:MAG: biopolymer transporter ExbD [Myxococcota bacterium]
MREHRQRTDSEINVLPVMNLMAVPIPFLLMAAQFMSLGVIDTALPAVQAGEPSADAPTLNLWIRIDADGYRVSGTDPMLHPDGGADVRLQCAVAGCPEASDYPVGELRRLLGYLKDEWPDETLVVVAPLPSVPYEVMVRTMDAARADPGVVVKGGPRPLFPEVVIASAPDAPEAP